MADQTAAIPTISDVFIRPGCTVCGLCEDNCPEVFDVRPQSSVVREGSANRFRSYTLQIIKAADECPVEVIRVRGFNEPV